MNKSLFLLPILSLTALMPSLQAQARTTDDATTTYAVSSATAYPGQQTFAPGNKEQMLLKAVVGTTGSVNVKGLTLTFASGTTDNAAADLENVKVYTSTKSYFYLSEANTLQGQTSAVTDGKVSVTFTTPVAVASSATFYVVADIKEGATVGHKVDAVLESVTYGDDTDHTFTAQSNPEGVARIYQYQSVPFHTYQDNSHYWRIPAMITLKHQTDQTKNGRIIVMADKRFDGEGDLSRHIDVIERHSDDNGKTWSTAQNVAGTDEDHKLVRSYSSYNSGQPGFGDAALVECQDGTLIAIMVAGNGFFYSTPDKPGEPFIITSTDAGDTWSDPVSLYTTVYNHTYTQGTLNATFAGSGRGLLLERGAHKGRIMFAMSHRFSTNTYEEYIIYSDDNGKTWHMSEESAYTGGDESKLVELNDGTVMISVRQDGNRGFNTSKDGGITWSDDQYQDAQVPGNRCNADVLYLGDHVLLHTYITNSARKNLYLIASYDNGKTWSDKIQICEPYAAYSTIDITKDGNIALLYEDGSWGGTTSSRDGYAINYVEVPKSLFVASDPGKAAYEAALAKAQTMTSTTGYRHTVVGTAGQYSQASLDALKKAVESADANDPDAAATAIEKAISAAEETAVVTVPGFTNDVYFTISTKENVKDNSSKPVYISAAGAPVDSAQTAVWQFTPNATLGQVNIKQQDQTNYLYRNGNTLAAASSKRGWTVTPDAAGHYYLRAMHTSNQSYLVADITSATCTFNFWSNTGGNTQWSTKFLLTPVAKKGKDAATYKKYDVKFVNAPAGAYVTYGADEAAANGGVMFLSESDVTKIKGEAAAQAARRASGFTAPASTDDEAEATGNEGLVAHDAGSYYATPTFDDEGTLTVTYSILPTFSAESSITESGWYQIKQIVSKSNSSALSTLVSSGGNYIGAAETGYKSTSGAGAGFYSLKYLTPSETKPAQSFLYITKNASNYNLQTVTGHYFNSKAIATTTAEGISITAQSSDNTFTLGSYYDYYAPGGTDSPLLGGYGASSTAVFQISKVDTTKYAVYHVSITGDPTTPTSLGGKKAVGEYAYVTYNGSANLGIANVYDKGAFFLQSGNTPTQSDFTPKDVGLCYTGTVSVDNDKKTVTVTYALDEAKVTALCDSATTLLNNRAVGSPTTSSSVYTTLSSAIETLKTTKNLTNINALTAAITSYRTTSAISDLVMPEDGKAYTITSVGIDGKRASYFKYQDSGYTLVATSATSNADYPMEAKFIARKISDGVYTFVNNAGKYFIWKGGSSSGAPESNKGYSNTYNANYKLTLEKMTTSGYTGSATNADFAGMMAIKGYRSSSAQNYFVIKNGTDFDHANVKFYKANGNNKFSSALLIEETTYPNTPSLGDSKGLEGAPYIGTFSAPFPTVIPEGVKAYYVKKNEDNTAVTEQVSTEAIPASQGVLLVSDENKGTLTMLPAATESADAGITDDNNLLGNSAGMENGKTFTEDEAYILTTKYGTASFHLVTASTLKINKSYLRKEAVNTSSRQISIRFGQGPATSIDALINPDKASNAPVYDLSGRRLNGVPAKGIYIQGGKKYVK